MTPAECEAIEAITRRATDWTGPVERELFSVADVRAICAALVAERDALAEMAKAARDGLALANACEATDGDDEYTAMIAAVRSKLRAALAAVPS